MFATSSLALSNAAHQLFYLDAILVQAAVIQYIHGPVFHLAALVLYAMMIAAFLRIVSCALSASHVYRKHYILLAVASAIRLAGDMAADGVRGRAQGDVLRRGRNIPPRR